jgi:DNA-binding transcriptional regulator YhcF (GntR family)
MFIGRKVVAPVAPGRGAPTSSPAPAPPASEAVPTESTEPAEVEAKAVGKAQKIAELWGRDVVAPGFAALPSIILEKQSALGLEPIDINIIMQIVKHWRQKDNLPFPSKRRIAEAIGIHPRTVQRRITAMVNAGFIRRVERRNTMKGTMSTSYDFSGLIKLAVPFANEAMEERRLHEQQTDRRLKRKRAKSSTPAQE